MLNSCGVAELEANVPKISSILRFPHLLPSFGPRAPEFLLLPLGFSSAAHTRAQIFVRNFAALYLRLGLRSVNTSVLFRVLASAANALLLKIFRFSSFEFLVSVDLQARDLVIFKVSAASVASKGRIRYGFAKTFLGA